MQYKSIFMQLKCIGDNWFFIKVVLNTYTNRYDFYVDGAKRYTGASFAEDVDEVSRLSFASEEKNTLYVDNVKVYDSASFARGMMPDENVYNVKDYGAKGDGVTDDTDAIREAIGDAAYTGGTVLLENGVFYSGQITLYSDMTLFIDESATIFANIDREVYTIDKPENWYNNKFMGRGIIRFKDSKNVRITGGGTIFGNGFYARNQNDPSNQRPCTIFFDTCEDVYIENINMVQSPYWTLVPFQSNGITIRNVSITNHVAPNRDGIDPFNCSNITVENCKVIAGDDAFCSKSTSMFPSRNVEVYNCMFQSYCNGIKFGTDSQGPISNYLFEDIYMKGVGMSGIALESVDGSDMTELTFRRIEMTDVDNVMFAVIGNRMRVPSNEEDKEGYKHLGSMLAGCAGTEGDVEKVELNKTELTMYVGESERLSTVLLPEGTDAKVSWLSGDVNVASVEQDGTVQAVSVGSTTITASAGGKNAVCSVTVVSDAEVEREGFLYYEEFENRLRVPGYLNCETTGDGAATVEDGTLAFSVAEKGSATARYEFSEALSGTVVIEARVKADSKNFLNALFLCSDEGEKIACLGMDACGFRSNDGTGWSATIARYEPGVWYDLRACWWIRKKRHTVCISGTTGIPSCLSAATARLRRLRSGVTNRIRQSCMIRSRCTTRKNVCFR